MPPRFILLLRPRLLHRAHRRIIAALALWAALHSSAPALVGPMGPGLFTAPPSALKTSEQQTVEAGQTISLAITATSYAAPTYQWQRNGVDIRGATGTAVTTSVPNLYLATLLIPYAQFGDAGQYRVVFANKQGHDISGTITLSVITPEPAIITQHPLSRSIEAGDAATFTVAATGTTLRYQWQKDGVPIPGATQAALTLSPTTPADAGDYTVIVQGGGATITSASATLRITLPVLPVFSRSPVSQIVATPSSVAFHAVVEGARSLQWFKDGVPVPQGTVATLFLPEVSTTHAGRYALAASNRAGVVRSAEAVLTVLPFSSMIGRLTNASILTQLGVGETMNLGFGFDSPGYSRHYKPVLVRAVGPGLAALGVSGWLPDPMITLSSGSLSQGLRMENDNWGGSAALRDAFQTVGAFPLGDPNSKDAALFQPSLELALCQVEVKDAAAQPGWVLAEVYDADLAPSGYSAPRLTNLSVRKHIATGDNLVTGFVIGGPLAATVLIRAVGPTLGAAPFNVADAMPDPVLRVFDSSGTLIAENDNWQGERFLTDAIQRLGGFSYSSPASKDAAVVLTLPPDSYTVQITPAAGTPGGTALAEIYQSR